MGLFFVIFSSIAGFISFSIAGDMLFKEGFIVGVASLAGVYMGIYAKHIVNIKYYKKYILALNIFILAAMLQKMFFS